MNGFINFLKPCGMSSSDAVFRVKRALGTKSVGHMGTLDPGAAGVLPIAVGKATRLFDYLLDKRKRYRAVFRFGLETDTLDSYGQITVRDETGASKVDRDKILAVIPQMCGLIDQVAPKYSAKKINGRTAYALARSEVEFQPPTKRVSIESIELLRETGGAYEFDVVCGGGTYIRSIVRDMASALGTVGYMQGLIRTASGMFRISDSVTEEELRECAASDSVPWVCAEAVVSDYPSIYLAEEWFSKLDNGVPVPEDAFERGGTAANSDGSESRFYRIYCRDIFFGMGEIQPEGLRLKSRLKDETNAST